MAQRTLVWDLPTRVFHWLLAASFAGAFLTAESERLRDVHVMLGYTMLGLVAFRLLWGLIGTRYARFGSWAFGPRSVLAYLKSLLTASPRHYLGHNPAAGWAVCALLALTVLAGLTGYAAYEEIGGHVVEDLHEGAANLLLAMVFVHLAGVLVSSLIHGENLVRAMIDGIKRGDPREGIRVRHRAVAAALVLAVLAFWLAPPELGAGSAASASGVVAQTHTAREQHDHDD